MMTKAEHAYWDAQWQINVLENARRHMVNDIGEDMLDVLLQWPKPVNALSSSVSVGTGTPV